MEHRKEQSGLHNKNAALYRLIKLYPRSSTGSAVLIVLAAVLAIIAGTALIASRSQDGLLAAIYQGRAKDARLTAEAGSAYIISEWNRPRNRRIYLGLPMSSWVTSNSNLNNRCTAPSPKFLQADANTPEATALAFKNGNEITLPGNGSRRFALKSVKFINFPRTATFTTSPTNDSDGSPNPLASSDNTANRGYVELEIEGRIYQGSSLKATSIIKREFEIEPKCCNRSFGKININDPLLGNDSRTCTGGSSLTLGDLGIVTGLSGGGLNSGSGNATLQLLNANNDPLNQVICIPPEGETTCGGTYDGSTISAANPSGKGKPRNLDYVTKAITIPDPPDNPNPTSLTASTLDDTLTISPPTTSQYDTAAAAATNPEAGIPGLGTLGSSCNMIKYPVSTSPLAYHCSITKINLQGGKTVTVDTTNYPVYLYLQDGTSSSINVGGLSKISHIKSSNPASLTSANDFQIRGIPSQSEKCTTDGQNFDLGANGISAFFIWAPCSTTKIAGTATWGGILWSNNLSLNGTGNVSIAIPNNNGTCAENPTSPPCKALTDNGLSTETSPPFEWVARSVNFTRFF